MVLYSLQHTNPKLEISGFTEKRHPGKTSFQDASMFSKSCCEFQIWRYGRVVSEPPLKNLLPSASSLPSSIGEKSVSALI